MFSDAMMAYETAKWDLRRWNRKAAEAWRFRHIKGKASQSLAAILTSLLAFFA